MTKGLDLMPSSILVKSALGLALSTLTVASFIVAAPASAHALGAGSAQSLTCKVSAYVGFEPGLTLLPKAASATSHSETVVCTGNVNGETVDPAVPGTLDVTAQFTSATCLSAGGPGSFTLTVTTDAGIQRTVTGSITVGTSDGQHLDVAGDLSGRGSLTPTQGDCVTAPLTQTHTDISLMA